MSQRNSEYARRERDLYETPGWVTRALIPHLPREPRRIWEPACGGGKMVAELCSIAEIRASDIEPLTVAERLDFLMERKTEDADAIITNPPFELARQFIEHALTLMESTGGMVAMLLRADYDHAKTRAHLFGQCPAFAKKIALTKRIAWFVEADGKPKGAPSYNHAWFVWDWQNKGAPIIGYAP